MKEIVIDIDAGGNVTVEGTGFAGPECKQLTAEIEAALGDVTKTVDKPEMRLRKPLLRKAGA